MNKMIMLLGLLVAIMSVSASGVGFIGTPTAELDQGQWNVGFNYTYISMDLDDTTTKFGDGSSEKNEINDNNVQRYYGTIGYGLTDVWEAYVQVGIADVKAQTREVGDPDWEGMNFDNDFAWGWGTRYTFHEQDNCRWGASVQMNWLDTSWDDKGTDTIQIDYESYDLIIAVGPTVDMGGWNLYGGPFYYMLDGDLDGKGTVSGSPFTFSGDLEEDSNIGGFVGVQCMLMEKYCITTELSFTGEGYAIGAGVAVLF